MKYLFATLATIILSCGLIVPAHATCNPPSKPGAVICFPTPNATVTFPLTIEGAATGREGHPIVKMILYADGVKETEVDNYDTFTWNWSYQGVNDPLEYNGAHHLVLNAWDNGGQLFQYSEFVQEIDGAIPQCAAPSTGFNICAPLNGNFYPESGVPEIASGAANIVNYDVYLNGKYQFSSQGRNLDAVSGVYPVTDKPITFTLVATDSSKKTYTKSTTFKEYWASFVCGRTSCNPGIFNIAPADYQDVGTSFVASAEVQYNTYTITAMKVYLDNTLVGSSTGPTIRTNVTASPGTHLLTFQAWDTTGALYKYQENVNVQ